MLYRDNYYQVEQGVGSCTFGRLLISPCKWADICQVVEDDSCLTAPFSGPLVVVVWRHPHAEWLAEQYKLLHTAVRHTQTCISSLHLASWDTWLICGHKWLPRANGEILKSHYLITDQKQQQVYRFQLVENISPSSTITPGNRMTWCGAAWPAREQCSWLR